MKKRKKISQSEIARRKKQSKRDYQINHINDIYKEEARKEREWVKRHLENLNIDEGEI